MLERLLSELKISKKKFAESIGASQGNVSDWFNRDGYKPSIDSLKRICEVHNVNINWLLTGKGSMFIVPTRAHDTKEKPGPSTSISSIPSIQSIDTPVRQLGKIVEQLAAERIALRNHDSVRIPVVGDIAAGKPIEIDNLEPLEYLVLDRSIVQFADDFLCFRIFGDSMLPELRHKDLVLINQRYAWEDLDQQIVAVNINGDVTIKVIHVDDIHQQSILYPINNRKHKSIILGEDNQDQVRILGILVLSVHRYS